MRPVGVADGVFTGFEDQVVRIPIATLLSNDSDVDGDTLSIAGFGGLSGQPSTILVDGQELQGFIAEGFHGMAFFAMFTPEVLFIGDRDYYGPAGFSYLLSDGNGGTVPVDVEIVLAGVNDAPATQADTFTARQDLALAISASSLLLNDADAETDPMTVVSVQNALHGTVSLAEGGYITFTPEAGYLGAASFTYTVSDDRGATSSEQVLLNVIPQNDPPVARTDYFSTVEDIALVLTPAQLLGNDYDPNGDTLSITRLDLYPERGAVAFDGNGNIVFTPQANYNGSEGSFFYWITDGRGEEVRGEVKVSIAPDNDAPYAVNDTQVFVTTEDVSVTLPIIDLLANDGDPDGDVLYFSSATAAHGQVTFIGEDLRYTPNADYNGADTVTYTVTDRKGGISNTATVAISVASVADAPVASAESLIGREGLAITIPVSTLLQNDRDGDGDAIRLSSVGPAVHGSVVLNGDDTVTFTPEAGYYGPASFSYTITDDKDGTSTAVVAIDLAPANVAPVAVTDTFSGIEDQPVIIQVADLLANDTDGDGDPLSFVSVAFDGDHGTAVMTPDGRIFLTPDADFVGTSTFTYTIADGTAAPVTGNIVVSYSAINDAPFAVDNFGYTTLENQAIAVSVAELLGNDGDVDGDAIHFVGFRDPIHGTVALVNGNAVFTTDAGFYGQAAYTYIIADASGLEATAQVSILVTPSNYPPIAVSDGVFTGTEDTVLRILPVNLLANDSDAEGQALTLTWIGNASGGNVAFDTDGSILFAPDLNRVGPASFEYRIADTGGRTSTATVSLFFAAVNDAPVAAADVAIVAEDGAIVLPLLSLLANDQDVENDHLTITSVQGATHGSVALDGQGNAVFTGAANYSGPAEFTYTISDGHGGTATGQVAATITPVNDAPVAVGDAGFATNQGVALTILKATLLGNDSDVDGDVLVISSVSNATGGTAALNGNGDVVFTPTAGYSGRCNIYLCRVGRPWRYYVCSGQPNSSPCGHADHRRHERQRHVDRRKRQRRVHACWQRRHRSDRRPGGLRHRSRIDLQRHHQCDVRPCEYRQHRGIRRWCRQRYDCRNHGR